MGSFKHIPNNGQKGKVTYNTGIVSGIVALAITEVEGVSLAENKKKSIRLYFDKNGIYADVSVNVAYGFTVPDVAFKIQQTIKHNVEAMTEYKVLKVDVTVQGVDFSDEQLSN